MKDIVIIIPTHSSYIGIVKNFLQLFKKNWPECPYDVIVSVTGEKVRLNDATALYCGKNASLIECVMKATKNSKNCICMLGDMFINSKVDNKAIVEIIERLEKDNIQYCSLSYVKNYKKEKKYSEELRCINNLDRYSHNFGAFFASRNFIENELAKYETDLAFEEAFLHQKENYYFTDHLIVRKNYFNLLPGITKGEWDRINFRRLKKSNPEIVFADRPIQSRKNSVICHVRGKVVSHLPNFVRVGMKGSIERVFHINFGVRG